MGSFDALAGVTTRLASTARIDEIVETVVQDVAGLGFGAVWMATLDETGGTLTTVTSIVDGVDFTREVPRIPVHDVRRPIGKGFRDRRMVNVTDPATVQRLDGDNDVVAPDRHALSRPVYDQLRGQPFACGPLFGRHGQPVGAVGLASYHGRQPIPDEVLANGEVRTFLDHLGFAVERALHIEQLTAKLGKAQAAIAGDARVKALGELAIAVAHDLNNLAGIALLAASVGMRSSADAVDMLPRIERANRAIGDLVARLQRIARAPTGEAPAADPLQIIEDIAIMAKPLLRERAIELHTELAVVPAVRCDAVLLHQVVLNLVVNAHDALAAVPAERRRIRIRLRGDGGVVRLTVADTGPGIAPEVLARLFQPFVTTKRDAHLGLGLAAAQAALRGFGAQIAARNAPSGGAEFEVGLAVAPALAAAPVREPPPVAAERRPARILAIDDDPDVVDIIRAYLEPVGHRVTTATASGEAIAVASAQPFDLVLCDIGMPEQNGIDVCRALRNAGYRGKLVLMTGWDHYGATTGVAFDMLIKKPFVGVELLAVIDSALAGSPG